MSPDIFCPQPRRSLKRALFEPSDISPPKRLCRSPRCFDPIPRSRSDSFLRFLVSTQERDRPKRDRRPTTKWEEADPINHPSQRRGSLFGNKPPTPISSPSIGRPSTTDGFKTPSRITTPANARASALDDLKSRAQSPSYRSDLFHNNIVFEHNCPEDIRKTYKDIASKERNSPGLHDVQAVRQQLRHVVDADEQTVMAQYLQAQLLPDASAYSAKIVRGGNCTWDVNHFPRPPLAPLLAASKPDLYYALDSRVFSAEEFKKQRLGSLRQASTPASSGHWPFLTIQFKAQGRGGTLLVAENQNARTGAICVESVDHLLRLTDSRTSPTRSISFSLDIDADTARICAHYRGKETYYSTRLRTFDMDLPDHIVEFRNCIRNIVEYGFQTRLPDIKNALQQLSLPELQAEEKRRKLHQREDETSLGSV